MTNNIIKCETCLEEYTKDEVLEIMGDCYTGVFICSCGNAINLKE